MEQKNKYGLEVFIEKQKKIIEKEYGQYEGDCTKCPYSKECEEYAHR